MKIIFLGAPGAGKGTQAEIVSERLNIPSISTGAIIREAIKTGTEMGVLAKKFIEQGMLVEGFENTPPYNCLYNFPLSFCAQRVVACVCKKAKITIWKGFFQRKKCCQSPDSAVINAQRIHIQPYARPVKNIKKIKKV